MLTVNPYLNFNGKTEEAFLFYQSIFGGEFETVTRFRDTPEASKLPAHELDKIMHIGLRIGKGTVLMATDALESMGQTLTPGNNFHLTICTESEAETDQLYGALSAGGHSYMPPVKTFWGAYFGMLTDRFGVQWMVNYDVPNPSTPAREAATEFAQN
ncbi:VOC family protein [Rufibacter sediminis]|uniref:VOC family protein n=1 Tax=Rufibacter sediminis TaxID=2762756 RepID=A0ABR6VYG9_9BACT|nr:VOC family protein [Rufibacter sediminis]MBC3542254.1 VOC family protein [Rufibacter sediminis]